MSLREIFWPEHVVATVWNTDFARASWTFVSHSTVSGCMTRSLGHPFFLRSFTSAALTRAIDAALALAAASDSSFAFS